MTEAELTLTACGVGLVAAPFAWRLGLGRPVAPPPEPRASGTGWTAPAAFALVAAQMLALGFVVSGSAHAPWVARLVLLAAIAAVAVVAGAVAPALVRPSLPRGAAIRAGVFTAFAAMPCVYGALLLQGLFVDIEGRQGSVTLLQERGAGWREVAFAAILLAPLVEELVFRVLVYAGLRRGAGPRRALFVSAALFGLVHFDPWTTILPMFVFGLILARLMERTGSYAACLTAHAGFNLFGVAAALAT